MHDRIVIKGARQHNLKNINLTVPRDALVVFTGVSGSGKSSIVFDTIASEAQRLLNENFSMYVRNFLPKFPQPDADSIENLSMAIVVDQKRRGGGSHSTMGTITDIEADPTGSAQTRWDDMQVAVDLMINNPLIGAGAGAASFAGVVSATGRTIFTAASMRSLMSRPIRK